MNEQNLKTESRTDWARIDAMTDDEIDTSDIPEIDDEFFKNAKLWVPKNRRPVTLNIENDVLEWFEKQGPEYQYRINAALKIYADAHRR